MQLSDLSKKLESRAQRYGYSNARVKAMKGLLLKSSILDEMIRVGTVEAMVELLQRTGYKNDLAGTVSYGGSSLIESGASKNFSSLLIFARAPTTSRLPQQKPTRQPGML